MAKVDLAEYGLRPQTEDEQRKHLIIMLERRCKCGRRSAGRAR